MKYKWITHISLSLGISDVYNYDNRGRVLRCKW
jgi:hypothetical protein